MRYVIQSKDFRRDINRLSNGRYRSIINNELWKVINTLANDMQLDYFYHDHALTGNLKGFRECHLAFDLVLIYKLEDDVSTLELSRIGSHSEVLGL